MNIIHRHVPNPNANGTHRRKKRENAETVAAQRVRRFLMAFPARLERAAFRLGVWRAASYIVRFIICLIV